MQCFRSFHTAERMLEGVEAVHMIGKGPGEEIPVCAHQCGGRVPGPLTPFGCGNREGCK